MPKTTPKKRPNDTKKKKSEETGDLRKFEISVTFNTICQTGGYPVPDVDVHLEPRFDGDPVDFNVGSDATESVSVMTGTGKRYDVEYLESEGHEYRFYGNVAFSSTNNGHTGNLPHK